MLSESALPIGSILFRKKYSNHRKLFVGIYTKAILDGLHNRTGKQVDPRKFQDQLSL